MDDKRFYRNLKQQVKKTGNRKRRRFLKDLSSEPGEFDFGSDESSTFNGRDGKNRKRKNKNRNGDVAKSDEHDTTNSSPEESLDGVSETRTPQGEDPSGQENRD